MIKKNGQKVKVMKERLGKWKNIEKAKIPEERTERSYSETLKSKLKKE